MADFSGTLKQLRRNAQMTQPQLAEKLGISRSAVGMYENGGREPDLSTLCAIADVFDVTLDELLSREHAASAGTLKEALFGDCRADDALLNDVIAYAAFRKERGL